ncbi:hypothetical protein ACLB2K_017166 [Fragaria x ananassa]
MANNHWQTPPDDVMEKILQRLSLKDQIRLRIVCESWQSIVMRRDIRSAPHEPPWDLGLDCEIFLLNPISKVQHRLPSFNTIGDFSRFKRKLVTEGIQFGHQNPIANQFSLPNTLYKEAKASKRMGGGDIRRGKQRQAKAEEEEEENKQCKKISIFLSHLLLRRKPQKYVFSEPPLPSRARLQCRSNFKALRHSEMTSHRSRSPKALQGDLASKQKP